MKAFTLYTFTFLSRAERVQWCLDELDLEYSLIKLDPFKGEIFTEEFTLLNPMRKMPVLIHHQTDGSDKILTESLAILEYLNNYANGNLKPKTINDLYLYDRAMFFGATEIEAYLWIANQSTILRGIYNWPSHTEKEAIRQVKKAMPVIYGWLARSNYIAGSTFSLADIYYYQLIRWARQYHVDTPNYIDSYLQRIASREAIPDGMR